MASTFLKQLQNQSYANQYSASKKADNKAAMGNAVAGGILTGLEGAVALGGAAADASQYGDTSYYQSMLEYNNPDKFNTNYYDNESVLSTYANGPQQFNVTAKDLNPTVGQSALKVGSGALQGAQTGLAIGGPWGAAVGALVGGGAVLAGDLYGRRGNELKADSLNYQQDVQNKQYAMATQTAADQAHEYQFGELYAHRKAEGGDIQTQEKSIEEYIARMKKRPRLRTNKTALKITKQYCDGGVRIHIK